MKSIAVSLSSSNTISDSREHTPLLHGHVQCRIHRRRCQLRAHRKDLVISNSGGTCHVGITAFVVPAPHGPLWISSDVLIETRQLEPKSPWHFHHEARTLSTERGVPAVWISFLVSGHRHAGFPLSCAFPTLPMPGFSHSFFSLASRVVRNSVLGMAPCESRVSRWRARVCHCVAGLNIHVPRQCVMLSFCSLVLCASPGCPPALRTSFLLCLFGIELRLVCALHISGSRENAASQCTHREHAPIDRSRYVCSVCDLSPVSNVRQVTDFMISPCASWAPPLFGGMCGRSRWLFPHRTTRTQTKCCSHFHCGCGCQHMVCLEC